MHPTLPTYLVDPRGYDYEAQGRQSQEEDVFADSEKLLIFLPKAKFLESNALLSLFSGHFLLSGPVVVFFSDLALLSVFKQSFQSC